MKAPKWLLGFAALLASSEGFAHSYLLESVPPNETTVPRFPKQLRLRFSEPLEPKFVKLHIDRDGKALVAEPAHTLSDDGREVKLATESLPQAQGRYEVVWDIVARDGHRSQGRIRFTLKTP